MKLRNLLLWMTLSSGTAWAHPDVDEAKAAFARGEFKLALLRLERAERSPDKTDAEVVDLLWYRGACLQRLSRNAEAARAFDALLQLRPLHEPDKVDVPPDLRATFRERAKLFSEAQGVRLGAPALQDGHLHVSVLRYPERVAAVIAFVRLQGDSSYAARELTLAGGEARGPLGDVEFWKGLPQGGVVEVALEARNARGTPLARAGDAVDPVKLAIDAASAQELVRRLTPAPAPVAAVTPTVAAPIAAPEETESPRKSLLLVAAASVGGLAGLVLVAAALSGVAGVALWGVFGGTWYAASSVKGIQVNPQYGLITSLYQYSLWPAVVFSGVGVTALVLGGGSAIVALGLFVARQVL